MTNKFKSTWRLAPRSEPEKWQQGVVYEFAMMPEEVDAFGASLKETFSGGLIYSSRIQPLVRNSKKKADASSIYGDPNAKGKIFDSLLDAGRATNKAQAYFRQPWPEEIASGNPEELLSYRDIPIPSGHDIFRKMGRCLEISWSTGWAPTSGHYFREKREDKVLDCAFSFIASSVQVNFIYDSEEPEAVAFLHDVEAFLLEATICDFASYDPCTHEVINPSRRDASQRRTPGVVKYASLQDRTYFGFCHRNENPPEVMGPRPEVRAAYRKEAGLLP